MEARPRPLVLCILDGFGERAEEKGNAVRLASTPHLDALYASCPHTLLSASGEAVGLPNRQVGSSEVGHTTLGAGRVVPKDRARIDQCIDDRKMGLVHTIDQSIRICLYDECRLHIFGLLSNGGVHSHMDHLFSLIDQASFNDIPVVVHCFLDGRDTPPYSAMDYIRLLEEFIDRKDVTIGTLSGRYYAMDRDERWDQTYQAFHAIVRDKVLGDEAPVAETTYDAVNRSYLDGLSDEFLVPTRIGDYRGIVGDFMCDFAAADPVWEWTGEECGFMFNFRGDRLRQLTAMLTREDLPEYVTNDLLMDRNKPVRAFREHYLATLTHYGSGLPVPVAFDRALVGDSLGEVLSKAGLKQLRCAESEKSPHVTRFFSGGREEPFEGESRKVVASPKLVDRYHEKPEMSAAKVAATVTAAIDAGDVDVIVVTFANPDVIGHSGDLDAAIAAVQAVDSAVGSIAASVRQAGGALLVTATHGNCERMKDDEGGPYTAHTDSPVPFIYLNERDAETRLGDGGSLIDVAPTVLDVLGIEQPAAMTGKTLRRGT